MLGYLAYIRVINVYCKQYYPHCLRLFIEPFNLLFYGKKFNADGHRKD